MFCWKAVLLLHLLTVSIYIPGFNQSWTEGKKNQQGGAFGAYQGARCDISRQQDACIRWKHEHVHCRRAAIQVNGFCCQVGTPRNVSTSLSMCFFLTTYTTLWLAAVNLSLSCFLNYWNAVSTKWQFDMQHGQICTTCSSSSTVSKGTHHTTQSKHLTL